MHVQHASLARREWQQAHQVPLVVCLGGVAEGPASHLCVHVPTCVAVRQHIYSVGLQLVSSPAGCGCPHVLAGTTQQAGPKAVHAWRHCQASLLLHAPAGPGRVHAIALQSENCRLLRLA